MARESLQSSPRLASAPICGVGTLAQNGYLTPVSSIDDDRLSHEQAYCDL
jgi:hypothetical protein